MGNYISCTFVPPWKKNTKATTARVVFPAGEVKQYRELVKAAELMLECPNHFLANSQSLCIGHRFSPLGADEELELGNVYLFFPMRRVHSVVTAADVAAIFVVANLAANKRLPRKARVLPEKGGIGESEVQAAEESCIPRLKLDGVDSGFEYRLSYCRSRKPGLETINEEPICLRGRQCN